MDSGAHMTDAAADSMLAFCATLLREDFHRQAPVLEGEFPLDGSRLQGMRPPITATPTFAIRKKALKVFALDEYVSGGIMTLAQVDVVIEAVRQHKNFLIVGGTGSGKTTLANAIINCMASEFPDERIVTIEDARELQLSTRNRVELRTSPTTTMSDLLRSTMRLRPDRILVGEVRGAEAYALRKAWNSGHPGGLATIHADSALLGLSKLRNYLYEAEETRGFPAQLLGEEIADMVDVLVFIEKVKGSRGRVVKEISRVRGYHSGAFVLEPMLHQPSKEPVHEPA